MRSIKSVTLDVGASELRAKHRITGKDEELYCVPNEVFAVDEESFRFKEVDDPLTLCEVVEAPSDSYKKILALGSTGRAYQSNILSLESGVPKTMQTNYYLEMLFVLAREAMREKQESGRDNFNYVIVTLIPIREHAGKEDCVTRLRAALVGDYTVKFPLYDSEEFVSFSIESKHIGVVPEGAVCMTAIRSEVTENEYTLVIDMGDVTTDAAIFKGTQLLGNKVASWSWAGRTLVSNLRIDLEDEGYVLSQQDAQSVLATGRVREGADEVGVMDIVEREKQDFVNNYLKDDILQLLNSNKLMPKQIARIVPIGAAMNESSGAPLYEMIMDACNLTAAEVALVCEDLRYANIEQASVYTKALEEAVVNSEES